MKIKELTLIPILGTIIFLTSLIKIPSIFPGAEFQMSAPMSVLIAMTFGPRIYILAGLIGSFLSFFTGISNIYGIIVALVFRIGVLVFILLIKNKKILPIICIFFWNKPIENSFIKIIRTTTYKSFDTCSPRYDNKWRISKIILWKNLWTIVNI